MVLGSMHVLTILNLMTHEHKMYFHFIFLMPFLFLCLSSDWPNILKYFISFVGLFAIALCFVILVLALVFIVYIFNPSSLSLSDIISFHIKYKNLIIVYFCISPSSRYTTIVYVYTFYFYVL